MARQKVIDMNWQEILKNTKLYQRGKSIDIDSVKPIEFEDTTCRDWFEELLDMITELFKEMEQFPGQVDMYDDWRERAEMEKEIPEEQLNELDLTATVTDQGFFISSSLAVLSGRERNKPSIPLKDGQYDFELLTSTLYEIKKKADTKFADTDEIIIMAESNITYQTIVQTMDASRQIQVEGEQLILFPNVSFSARIY